MNAYDMYGTPLEVGSIVRCATNFNFVAMVTAINTYRDGVECQVMFEHKELPDTWYADTQLVSMEHPTPALKRHETPADIRQRRLSEVQS